jgi:hypothetical protein
VKSDLITELRQRTKSQKPAEPRGQPWVPCQTRSWFAAKNSRGQKRGTDRIPYPLRASARSERARQQGRVDSIAPLGLGPRGGTGEPGLTPGPIVCRASGAGHRRRGGRHPALRLGADKPAEAVIGWPHR